MHQRSDLSRDVTFITYLVVALLFVTISAIVCNTFYYKFPGNNYFPKHCITIPIVLTLIYLGCVLQFKSPHKLLQITKETLYFFFIMALLALATNAVQYTPFKTIDAEILWLESSCAISLPSILSWAHKHPWIQLCLSLAYDTLPYQMTAAPLLIIATGRIHRLYEYYGLLLMSTLIGFTFYYFFPTTAPASVVHSAFFSEAQRATGLKFSQLHHHIKPTTLDGGLIGMPSFHVIWAWLCFYLLRDFRMISSFLFIINLLLIISCVLLGWHYLLDLIGSLIVIVLSHAFLRVQFSTKTKRTSSNSEIPYAHEL